MKFLFCILLASFTLTIRSTAQQIDKDGRAILTGQIIKEFSDLIYYQMNYSRNKDVFKSVMVNTIRLQASQQGRLISVTDALIALQEVSSSKTNRDLVIEGIKRHAGSLGVRGLLVNWGLSSRSANAIDYYANHGMGASRKELNAKIADNRRIELEAENAQKLEAENREMARRLAEEKIDRLKSKVYDMRIEKPLNFERFKHHVYSELVKQVRSQNTSKDKQVTAKYVLKYSDSPRVIGSGVGSFAKLSGDEEPELDKLKEFRLSHVIEDIQVPIKYLVDSVDFNYVIGRTTIKISKKGVIFKGSEPTSKIQQFITDRMSGKLGIYSVEYIFGEVCGYSVNTLYDTKGQTTMGTILEIADAIR